MDISGARNRKIVLLCMLWDGSHYNLFSKVRDELMAAYRVANLSLYSADVRGTFCSSFSSKFFDSRKNVFEMPVVLRYYNPLLDKTETAKQRLEQLQMLLNASR